VRPHTKDMYRTLKLEGLLEVVFDRIKGKRVSGATKHTYQARGHAGRHTARALTSWSKIVYFHRDELPRDKQSASMAVPYC